MSLTELLALLEQLGSTPSEDAVGLTELDHGLQCAFELAQRRPADIDLHVAGLVHDVGRQFGPDDIHARLGAELIRPVLGDRIASLVDAHVTAKRYLVASDPSYSRLLSTVSTTTLVAQGGPLDGAATAAFRAAPWFEDALELRRADDAAKVPGRIVPGLDHWGAAVREAARVGR
jgi:predicted HD phosphohydrolase